MNDTEWAVEASSGEEDSPFKSPYTFYGICCAMPEACFYKTNMKTRADYLRNLNSTILPCMDGHNEKNIAEYTREDYDRVISRIRERGTLDGVKRGTHEPYKENSIQKFRVIIYRIVSAAAGYGYCQNVLSETIFCLSEKEAEELRSDRARIFVTKKSVTPKQEAHLYDKLLSDPRCVDGRTAAAVITAGCGARLNEAAGARFGSIKELPGHTGTYCLYVVETTELGSSEVKSSGKTANAVRPLPLAERVAKFLLARKAFVDGELTRMGIPYDINDVPIGCIGRTYLSGCSSDDVSACLKEVYEEVGIEKKTLAVIDAELTYGSRLEIEERSASGYLCRHVFATMLGVLDLDETDIQFIIGHQIEDPNVRRSDLTGEDNLYRLKRELDKIPVLGGGGAEPPVEYSAETPCFHWKGDGNLNAEIVGADRIVLSVKAKEAYDNLELNISAPGMTVRGFALEETSGAAARRLDLTQDYRELFQGIEKRKKRR